MKLRIVFAPLALVILLSGSSLIQSEQEPIPVEECGYNEDMARVEDYMSLITISDPYLGNIDASVTVIEYFDPNCQHCKNLHPIMKQVVADSGQHARFFMIPFMLWRISLIQIEALYVAGQDGLYYEMLEAQYDNRREGGMSMDQIVVLAEGLGIEPDKFRQRMERGLNQKMIIDRRQEITDLGVTGTPSVMINGRFITAESKSRQCMNELIAEIAIENAEG